MTYVKPKKHLGQHFLTNPVIAKQIVDGLENKSLPLLEIGPGTGVLTDYLIHRNDFVAMDVDIESIEYLKKRWPEHTEKILLADFLKTEFNAFKGLPYAIIGNLPYNISSQIFFKVLECRNQVDEVVCMIQKEVAERIACKPGSKTYGILSVLLQAYYSIEYLFTVHENSFNPPPKVKSGVIRLKRNDVTHLNCNETIFKQVVKTAFNQRRKMLRNSLKPLINDELILSHSDLLHMRPEQLSVSDFVSLTALIERVKS